MGRRLGVPRCLRRGSRIPQTHQSVRFSQSFSQHTSRFFIQFELSVVCVTSHQQRCYTQVLDHSSHGERRLSQTVPKLIQGLSIAMGMTWLRIQRPQRIPMRYIPTALLRTCVRHDLGIPIRNLAFRCAFWCSAIVVTAMEI